MNFFQFCSSSFYVSPFLSRRTWKLYVRYIQILHGVCKYYTYQMTALLLEIFLKLWLVSYSHEAVTQYATHSHLTLLWLLSMYFGCGTNSQATPRLLSKHAAQAAMSLLATNCLCLEVWLSLSLFTWWSSWWRFSPAENAIAYYSLWMSAVCSRIKVREKFPENFISSRDGPVKSTETR